MYLSLPVTEEIPKPEEEEIPMPVPEDEEVPPEDGVLEHSRRMRRFPFNHEVMNMIIWMLSMDGAMVV
ncbi:unnamed protein product [Microthlaspi erraticum]|uniref:Uncharacterized protein n=1 Tax=Microthlaspi erraticum TaxID=1685480 RepID=A0A6D2IJH6_9BRAS|nr:unnamed protein product [Microthlaspi erraticum]